MTNKKTLSIAAAICLSILLCAVSVGQAQQEPIRIGALLPLSGNYGFLGLSERPAIAMAIEEFNQKGGIMGRKIEVIEEDCATDPALTTRKATRMLKSENVDFFLVGGGSSTSAAMAEFAKREKVVCLAIDPNSDILTGEKTNRYFFLVPVTNHMIAQAFGPVAADVLGKKWYFFTHDYTWGWTLTEEMRKVLKEKGGVEIGESKIPLNTRDYSSYLIKARNSNADVLMIDVAGVDATSLFEQIYEFGIHEKIKVAVPLLDFEDSWAVGPEKNAVIALAGVEWHYTLDAPGVKETTERFKKMFPRAAYPVPTTNFYNTYIGVRELLRAVERANSTKAEDVVKAMEGWVVKDSLKKNPTVIRAWDHQFVQDFYMFRCKDPKEAKEWSDVYEYVGLGKGEDIAISRADSKAVMEKFPGE